MRESNNLGPAESKLRLESGRIVRNRDFPRVYYNNGNSLPVSSIPTSWDLFRSGLEACRTQLRLVFLVHNGKQNYR
jgi:hypothetical protein